MLTHSKRPKVTTISVIANRHRQQVLSPLVDAYFSKGFDVVFHDLDLPDQTYLEQVAPYSDAIIVVGPGVRSPGTVLQGPVINLSQGKAVPVGWVPHLSDEGLSRFAKTAETIHKRHSMPKRPVALLAQWLPRYLRLAKRIDAILEGTKYQCFRWTSDLVFREDMLHGLRLGLAAAFYLGHGRPNGWCGYYGIRAHHFETTNVNPMGALFCLCCRTASRKRTGVSFSEKLLSQGVAGAVLASTKDTLHLNNTRWAVSIMHGLRSEVDSIGALIANYLPVSERAITDYRIIGDPLAPLRGEPESLSLADKIPVYP